ncbi:hypothetical protein ACV36C_39490, partial [Pseudomonas aeruginosa]
RNSLYLLLTINNLNQHAYRHTRPRVGYGFFMRFFFTKTEIYKDRTMNQIAPISNQTVQAGVQTALNPLT